MFRVGQKVVCVRTADASTIASWGGIVFPEVDCVYHVRGYAANRLPCIWLVEIDNAVITRQLGFSGEGAFPESAFRPIVERKTSISIFTKMLKTEHADV